VGRLAGPSINSDKDLVFSSEFNVSYGNGIFDNE